MRTIILTLFIISSNVKAEDCYYKLKVNELDKLNRSFKEMQDIYPWHSYQYNGYSVSADKYNVDIMREHFPNQDPNERMP